MKKVLLKIDGMTCSACSSGLEKYLNKQEGIKQATVNLIMNNANIEYDDKKLTLEQVEKFVEKAGFTSLGIDNFEKEEKKKTNEKYKLIAITIISILVLYISMSHMVGMPVISFLDMMTHPADYAISLFIFLYLQITKTFSIILSADILFSISVNPSNSVAINSAKLSFTLSVSCIIFIKSSSSSAFILFILS